MALCSVNHLVYLLNITAQFYDVAQSQGSLGTAATLINGVVPGPISIPNPDVIEAPILSEDQFNILRRNFLEEEAKYVSVMFLNTLQLFHEREMHYHVRRA